MPELRDLVEPPLVHQSPLRNLERRARSIRRRRRAAWTAGGAGLIAVMALAATTLTNGSETSRVETVDEPPAGGLFSVETGVTLLYDDGYDGIVAVDVDQGVAQRFTFEHKGPGDPSSLTRVNDRLVFAGDDVYSVPIDLGDDARLIRELPSHEGLVLLPAGEAGDAIWTASYQVPRGEPDAAATATQLDEEGRTLVDPVELGPVVAGWANGVVTGTASIGNDLGLRVWDADTREFIRDLDSGDVVATRGSLVAQADHEAGFIVVTDVENGDETRVTIGLDGSTLGDVRFSPDGSRLAIMVGGVGEERSRLHLVEIASDEVSQVLDSEMPPFARLTWTPDGTAIFFSSEAFGHEPARLGFHRLGDDDAEVVTVDFLDRPEAQEMIQAAIPGGPGGAAQIAVTRAEGPDLPDAADLPRCRVEFRPGTNPAVPELPVIPPGPCRLR